MEYDLGLFVHIKNKVFFTKIDIFQTPKAMCTMPL